MQLNVVCYYCTYSIHTLARSHSNPTKYSDEYFVPTDPPSHWRFFAADMASMLHFISFGVIIVAVVTIPSGKTLRPNKSILGTSRLSLGKFVAPIACEIAASKFKTHATVQIEIWKSHSMNEKKMCEKKPYTTHNYRN